MEGSGEKGFSDGSYREVIKGQYFWWYESEINPVRPEKLGTIVVLVKGKS